MVVAVMEVAVAVVVTELVPKRANWRPSRRDGSMRGRLG